MDFSKEDFDYVREVALHVWLKTGRQHDIDDLIQSGWIGFIQAKLRFSKRRGRLYGFAFARTKGAMLDWIRSEDYASRHTRKMNPDFAVVSDEGIEGSYCPDYAEMVDLAAISGKLKGRHLEIWDMHCMGMTGREIAKCIGVDASRICQILKEIKNSC